MAERQLQTTIEEVETTKFYRSTIVALSLWGKLALMQGDIDSAVKHSTKAVQDLQKMGTMPLVRMEEVFFNHYCVLKSTADSQNNAKNYLDQTYKILQQKAESLKNEEYKRTFLERVPISCAILAAVDL